MNYRKWTALLLALAIAVCSGACGKNETGDGSQDSPDLSRTATDIVIDWNQVMEDCEDYLNHTDYPYGKYLDFAVHEEEQRTELYWPLSSDCPKEVAIEYAKAYIRAFNDSVCTQDYSYALSTDTYYGGYWDTHDCDLMIFWERDLMDPDNFLINEVIEAGSNGEIWLQERTADMESREAETEAAEDSQGNAASPSEADASAAESAAQ